MYICMLLNMFFKCFGRFSPKIKVNTVFYIVQLLIDWLTPQLSLLLNT